MSELFIGILGAAKSGRIAACDGDGRILGNITTNPLSLRTNPEIHRELLRSLAALAQRLRIKPSDLTRLTRRICVAMSGVFQRNDETSVLTLLRDIDLLGQCPPVICEDVWATLATASLDAGAVVMASTGSNVFLRDRMQRYVRIGGWGSELGDLGSGYHIGKMAIRAILDLKQANPPPAAGGE